MYIYEIYKKYTWNIYVFITYKVFKKFLLQWINFKLKKQKYTFCHGQK